MSLSAEDRAWLLASRRASGVPERLTETVTVQKIVGLVKGGQSAGREVRRRAS